MARLEIAPAIIDALPNKNLQSAAFEVWHL
jgi:hypothetical protein